MKQGIIYILLFIVGVTTNMILDLLFGVNLNVGGSIFLGAALGVTASLGFIAGNMEEKNQNKDITK